MGNEPIQLAAQQLGSAKNILIIAGNSNNLDAIAAGLALREFLIKHEKQVLLISHTPVSPKLKFLPEAESVKPLSLQKNLVLDISTSKKEVSELRYQKFEDRLSIFLTAKDGEFNLDDVKIRPAVYPFDLIVTIGIGNLEELADFYAKHAQMFFETPVVNIDFRAENENYGQINFVNLTAAANAEMVFDLLAAADANYIDGRIATLLLTGLIAQTNSFQSIKTSPQVFMKASQLVNLGARQQDIITQLYRSKSFGLLRLWGRVLARLKHDLPNQLVYSSIPSMDIEKSEATAADLDEIINEMKQQLPFAKTFLFLAESGAVSQTSVYFSTVARLDLSEIAAGYKPVPAGEHAIKFIIPKPLAEAEAELLSRLQPKLMQLNS